MSGDFAWKSFKTVANSQKNNNLMCQNFQMVSIIGFTGTAASEKKTEIRCNRTSKNKTLNSKFSKRNSSEKNEETDVTAFEASYSRFKKTANRKLDSSQRNKKRILLNVYKV